MFIIYAWWIAVLWLVAIIWRWLRQYERGLKTVHQYDHVLLKFGTLVYLVPDVDHDDQESVLVATCPDAEQGRTVADAVAYVFGLNVKEA